MFNVHVIFSAYACTPEAYEAAVKGFEEKLRHRSHKTSNSSNKKSISSAVSESDKSRNNSVDVGVDSLQQLQEPNNVNNCGNVGEPLTVTKNGNDDKINGATINDSVNKDCDGECEFYYFNDCHKNESLIKITGVDILMVALFVINTS